MEHTGQKTTAERAEDKINHYLALAKKEKENLRKLKARERSKSKRQLRKEREHRIFTLGGIVEKMGLDMVDQKFLIGLMWLGSEIYSGRNMAQGSDIDVEFLRLQSEQYLKDGAKKDRPK
ncbi:MAG: conjugal transfer protein TraD [Pseudomonadota bacterium]